MNNPIYITDISKDHGHLMIGGVWRLWHQDGFPVEMSWLHARDQGNYVDWVEAMADASTDDNLPALVKQMESFLTPEDMMNCKMRFMALLNSGQTYQSILDSKHAKAPNLPYTAI